MPVIIGSARTGESGLVNQKAGDQKNGAEVSTQNFYVHSKGWYVLRAKSQTIANKLASAMDKACKNNNIGYDQFNRNTLYNSVKSKSFDPSEAKSPIETDCSALVRVCLAYAGVMVQDFNTATEKAVIEKTGKFTTHKYSNGFELKKGDILVTQTKGHTAIVVSVPEVKANYYKRYLGSSVSIVDALGSVGEKNTSLANRKRIAKANGISSYNGTSEQNNKLVNLLKAGKLKKA